MSTMTNAPESEALTMADITVFENARAAVALLRKSFDSWITIGRAVVRAREIAEARGGKFTFRRLLEQQSLASVLGKDWTSQKTTASKLEKIIDCEAEVVAWRATLTQGERDAWSAPTTIYKHFPAFNKPERITDEDRMKEPPETPMQKLRREKTDLEHRCAYLEERLAAAEARDGSLYDVVKSSAKQIFDVWRGHNVSRYKMKQFRKLIDDHLKEDAPGG